jgi:hypothetical protein
MNDNVSETVWTASATLIGGILLLISNEFFTKLIIAPTLKLRGSFGEAAYYLVLRSEATPEPQALERTGSAVTVCAPAAWRR